MSRTKKNPNKHNGLKIQRIKTIVWYRDNFTCIYCGRNMRAEYEQWKDFKNIKRKKVGLTVDHLKPKSKGGTWDLNNLVTACQDCNNLKGNKYYEEELCQTTLKPKKKWFLSTIANRIRGILTSSQTKSLEKK